MTVLSSTFIRFLVAGGIAAGANFGSRFLFSEFMPYAYAVFCAYLVGMTVGFLLMREHVFAPGASSLAAQVVKFTLVNAVAVLQTLIISLALAHWVLPDLGFGSYSEAIAHLVGVVVPVISSYFGHSLLTFK